MRTFKIFFVLTLVAMFMVTSCTKETLTPDSQSEIAAFKDAVDESKMIPSSDLQGNAEFNIEKLTRDLADGNQANSRACEEVVSLEIQHWTPGSCLVQLATQTKREVGQNIRIVHYAPGTGLLSDYTFTGTYGEGCTLTGLNFSIPYTTFPGGTIVSYVMIMDGVSWVDYDYVVWQNCSPVENPGPISVGPALQN